MLVPQKDIPTLKFSEPMNEALFGENKDLLTDAFKLKISGWDHPGLSTKLKDICKRHTQRRRSCQEEGQIWSLKPQISEPTELRETRRGKKRHPF